MSTIYIEEFANKGWTALFRNEVESINPRPISNRPVSAQWAIDHILRYHAAKNNIGIPGQPGFGVGLFPQNVPTGFFELDGTKNIGSPQYGNYAYTDGSVMVWIPAFYYRIGHENNPTYSTYLANSIDVKPIFEFSNPTVALENGYIIPQAFYNNDSLELGFMIDKYQCSNNNGIASSIRLKVPLSTASARSPFTTLHNVSGTTARHAFDAAKTRGTSFQITSRQQYTACALLSMAHAQASTNTEVCAWHDPNGITNYPKGNNNNLSDVDDSQVRWVTAGYGGCGLTGSAGIVPTEGNLFAKSTHNGQDCGVADLNGNMWELSLGITRPGATDTDNSIVNDDTAFFILKNTIDSTLVTGDWNTEYSAFGDSSHLLELYDKVTITQLPNSLEWICYGSGTNQVLSNDTTGLNQTLTSFGIFTTAGSGSIGINLFGNDAVWSQHSSNLISATGGSFNNGTNAGIWAWTMLYDRNNVSATGNVGFRSSTYLQSYNLLQENFYFLLLENGERILI